MKANEFDYLVVGQGLAGSFFALKLWQNNKKFQVIDNNIHKASAIAAGVYNPIVLKRFSLVWDAKSQLEKMHSKLSEFENLLGKKYDLPLPLYRIFSDENDKHAWLKKASRNEKLRPYLSDEVIELSHDLAIDNPLGCGEVLHCGRVKVRELLDDFHAFLKQNEHLKEENFDYEMLDFQDFGVIYKGVSYKKIIFAEGYHVKHNPYFNWLPIIGNKGEVLKIKIEDKLPDAIIKAKEFLIPEENNEAFLGATYESEDLTYLPTESGKNQLEQGLKKFYKKSFSVLSHHASIRPTVEDRRPILGKHPIYDSLVVLNGMGTRGTMLAPGMSDFLYDYLENNADLDASVDVKRFFDRM